MDQRYQIGDIVYGIVTDRSPQRVPCPDCLGVRHWVAILPNHEVVRISCPSCTFGYEVRGFVELPRTTGYVGEFTVSSVRYDSTREEPWEFLFEETSHSGGGQIWRTDQIYDTREEAEVALPDVIEAHRVGWADQCAKSHKVRRGTKNAGSMIAYYRAQLRDAERSAKEARAGIEREGSR